MKRAQAGKAPKILVIDAGGTNIKLLATGQKEPRKIPSGPAMTAGKMVREVKVCVRDWKFERVSLGYPVRSLTDTHFASPITWGAAGCDSTSARLLAVP
jgi:hypothetical protein